MPRLRIGDWLVDRGATNEIRRGSEVVHLEPKVADLLIVLAGRPGEPVSREALLAQVWPGVVVGEDVLTQCIIKLRKALGDNFKEPVYIQTIPKRGYRLVAAVSVDAELDTPATPPALLPAGSRRAARLFWILAGALLASGLVGGYWQFSRSAAERSLAPNKDLADVIAAAQTDNAPRVIVYPFKEVMDDARQGVLARGMTARLITDLGRFPDIRVISLQDTTGAAPVEAKTDVRRGDYVVSGELQRSGDKIRLYVRLTQAASAESLWSEQYDRPYGDLLLLQDELTREVVDKLRIKVSDAELRRRARPYTRNLQAYEYFLRAQSALLVRRRPDNDAARALYLKAIELDPTFARARAGLALTYAADRRNGWAPDGDAALAKAIELATAAQQMEPDTPEVYFALAFVNMERGELTQASANLREALRLNPSYADAYALMAGIQTYRGRPQETIPLIGAATRLAPDSGYLYFLILGRAYFFLGDVESASLYLREALTRNPENVEAHIYLAVTLAGTGQREAAMWEAVQIRALEPAFKTDAWLQSYPMTDAAQRERLAQALRSLDL